LTIQDEHKISLDELVKRLETSLRNVSIIFQSVLCEYIYFHSKKIEKQMALIQLILQFISYWWMCRQ